MVTRSPAKRLAMLGMLLGGSLVLYALEATLPAPFPFVRIGLANVATLLAVLMLGPLDALLLAALRATIASLVVGTFLGPGFLLSMGGGLAAAAAMSLAVRFALPPLGVVGVSLIGAATHNVAQLGVVAGVYGGPVLAVKLMPAALLVGVVAGLATGLVALFAFEKLARVAGWRFAYTDSAGAAVRPRS
jgi:heptaprenyl diphosphate synthase